MGVRLYGDILDTHNVDYFQTLYTTNFEQGHMESLLHMELIINETMINDLSWDYKEDEVIKALKQNASN